MFEPAEPVSASPTGNLETTDRPSGTRDVALAGSPVPPEAAPAAPAPIVEPAEDPHPGPIAAVLARLGQHAAERYTARIGELQLSPQQAGIIRAVGAEPGRSQQALSEQLSLLPSRVVAFVDDLEQRGLIERRRNAGDRRLYALHLTEAGDRLLAELARVSDAHEAEFTAGLTSEQRTALADLLAAVADRQRLPAGRPGA